MPFIEAPTTFYLGRRFDPQANQMVDDVVYYDSRDLVTHAVVVGMTGSGKTGLCITLLEEAGMDNIPSIIIDPKGDITNLLLTFPNLTPEEFLPWINQEDAQRAGLNPQEMAQDVAMRWREGLRSWGIGPQRIHEFKQRTNISIFTPGSDAGLPISIMDALQPPREGWIGYEENHRERISGIVTALLALAGIRAQNKDREHVLLSNIIEYAWMQGLPLSLQDIIVQVQQPPFNQLGVFDINTFFPEKDRFKLAIEMNNIVASPSFRTWLQGEPLDVRNLLYTPDGRPRTSIFYIAHLTDEQRSFIITLLLENVVAWMRTLGGTSSLRALVYFDEVFGHFPPYPRNPPTKEPILRLLKQARAFGIGMILATQNPGDLDYKGLSNAGTWFIGKLQTENDKKKVLDGLATAAAADHPLDLGQMNQLLSTIAPRVFVMNNVHDAGGPILMHTRWAMCYLRGPLTRQQVNQLMARQKQQVAGGYYGQPVYQQPYAQQATQPPYGTAPVYQQPPSPYGAPPPPAPLPGLGGFESRSAPGMIPNTPPAPPAFNTPPGAPPPPPFLPETPPPPPSLPGFGTFQQPAFDPGGYQQPPQPANPYAAPPLPNAPAGYGASGGYNYPAPTPAAPPAFTPPPAAQIAPPAPVQNTQASVQVVSNQEDWLPAGYRTTPPVLPSNMAQYYLPANIPLQQAIAYWEQQSGMRAGQVPRNIMLYRPFLLAQVQVRYADRKMGLNMVETYAFHLLNVERSGLISWEQNVARPVNAAQLSREPFGECAFGELPPGVSDKKRMTELEKDVVDYIYKTTAIAIPINEELKVYGAPGAPFADFQARVQAAARGLRDGEVDKVTEKFGAQFERLEEKYRNKARTLESERESLQGLGRETLATMGEAAISLFQGRTIYTLSRVARVRRFQEEAKSNVQDNEAELNELQRQMDDLQQRFEMEIAKINDKWGRIAGNFREERISPLKKDIHIELFGIGWKPFYYLLIQGRGETLPAWQGMVSAQVDTNRRGYQSGQPVAPALGYQQQPAQPAYNQYPQQPGYGGQPPYNQAPLPPPQPPSYADQYAGNYYEANDPAQGPAQPYVPPANYNPPSNSYRENRYNEQGYNVPPVYPTDDY